MLKDCIYFKSKPQEIGLILKMNVKKVHESYCFNLESGNPVLVQESFQHGH